STRPARATTPATTGMVREEGSTKFLRWPARGLAPGARGTWLRVRRGDVPRSARGHGIVPRRERSAGRPGSGPRGAGGAGTNGTAGSRRSPLGRTVRSSRRRTPCDATRVVARLTDSAARARRCGVVHSGAGVSAFFRGRRGFAAGARVAGSAIAGVSVGAASTAGAAAAGTGGVTSGGRAVGGRAWRSRPALGADGPAGAFWALERSAARFSSCARVHLKR